MLPALATLVLALAPQHHDGGHGTSDGPPPALTGLDPVELTKGSEVFGQPQRARDRNGFRYLFASDESAAAFDADPGRFEIQLGGGCGSMGPLSGAGDPERYFVHAGRIYVFASDQCRHSFQMKPERFVEQPEVAPTTAGMAAARARGHDLLEGVVAAVGGAQALDAITGLTLEVRADRKSGETTSAWSECVEYDFASGSIARTERWDDWTFRHELSPHGLVSTVVSPEAKPPVTERWAARHELDVQTSRELVFLLRQRANPALDLWTEGVEDGLERLVLRWNGRHTTAFVEPTTGIVRRLAWTGRLGSGPIAPVVVDFDDFGPAGPLTLPRARTVSFDGAVVPYRSGALARLEVSDEATR